MPMSLFDDADFAHLEPVGTFEYTLSRVNIPRTNPDPVVLLLKHTGMANERYQGELKSLNLKGKPTDKQYIALFAKHGIAGWKNVKKGDAPVPYTTEGGAELLAKLLEIKRGDIVMGARIAAADADNFETPVADAGDLGNG